MGVVTVSVPLAVARAVSTVLGLLAGSALVVGGVTDFYPLGFVGFPLVGAVILWHRPGHRIGSLCVFAGIALAISVGGKQYVGGPPGRGPILLEQVTADLGPWSFIALVGIVALFPTGHATNRAVRIAWWTAIVVGGVQGVLALMSPLPLELSKRTNPWGVEALRPAVEFLFGPGFVVVPVLIVLGLGGLVSRWRRSSGVERLQYRWFFVSVLLTVVCLVMLFATSWQNLLVVIPFNAMPVAIGVAVTRYGLYDLDRIISRTASYAIVTALVIGVYGLVVTSVSRFLPGDSPIVIAFATLAAAAVAQPALGRVRVVVDRRFNRQRYDAERTVDAFGASLRDQLDHDDVNSELLRLSRTTMEPAFQGLWLTEGSR